MFTADTIYSNKQKCPDFRTESISTLAACCIIGWWTSRWAEKENWSYQQCSIATRTANSILVYGRNEDRSISLLVLNTFLLILFGLFALLCFLLFCCYHSYPGYTFEAYCCKFWDYKFFSAVWSARTYWTQGRSCMKMLPSQWELNDPRHFALKLETTSNCFCGHSQ